MLTSLRPTLKQVFGFSLLGLILSLALLFYLVLHASERTILQSAERFRDSASREVIKGVTAYLNEAPLVVARFEEQVRYGLVDPKQPDSIQAGLLSLLLANEIVSEASFTYADKKGFDRDGNIEVNQSSAGQVMVFRSSTNSEFVVRRTSFDGTRFVSESRVLHPQTHEETPTSAGEAPSTDPTLHLTFR